MNREAASIELPAAQLWREEVELLRSLAASVPSPGVIVEIGTAQGGSAAIIAQARLHEDILLHTFDPCPAASAIQVGKIFSGVHVHPMNSAQGEMAWASLGNSEIDLVLIDGSHTFANVFEDYSLWRRHLKPGATVLFHDYDEDSRGGASHPGVQVLCATVLSEAQRIRTKRRAGRYLALSGDLFPELTFSQCQAQATRFVDEMVLRSSELSGEQSQDDIAELLAKMIGRHSRLGSTAQSENGWNDLQVDFHLLRILFSHPSSLLPLIPEHPPFFKWMECLEMMLRSWGIAHPEEVVVLVRQCRDSNELSRLLGSIHSMVVVVEHVCGMLVVPTGKNQSKKTVTV